MNDDDQRDEIDELEQHVAETHGFRCACGEAVARRGGTCQRCSERAVQDVLRQVGAVYGFGTQLPTRHVFRCRCGIEVPERGTLCPQCGERELAELRAMHIARARKTLPTWPYARFGHPSFRADATLVDVARGWRLTERIGLTLIGPTRRGKSSLAVALCVDRMDRATTTEQVRLAAGIRYMLASDLDKARSEHALGRDEAPLVRSALRATVLVLDDLGKEKTKGEVLTHVLEKRYTLDLPNIITSELTLRQLGDRYGLSDRRRVAGRLLVGSCHLEGAA